MAEIYNPWDAEMYPQPLELTISEDAEEAGELPDTEEEPGGGHRDMMKEALDVIEQQSSVIKQLMEMLAPSSEAE